MSYVMTITASQVASSLENSELAMQVAITHALSMGMKSYKEGWRLLKIQSLFKTHFI